MLVLKTKTNIQELADIHFLTDRTPAATCWATMLRPHHRNT
jgi:hypothetical protein